MKKNLFDENNVDLPVSLVELSLDALLLSSSERRKTQKIKNVNFLYEKQNKFRKRKRHLGGETT